MKSYFLPAIIFLVSVSSAVAQPAVLGPIAGPGSGQTKFCSPFVPNAWRAGSPVPSTWGMNDCRQLALSYGASHYQVGCVFEKEPAPLTTKFSLGNPQHVSAGIDPTQRPAVNCGWE